MVIQSNIKFIEHAKAPIVSRTFFNPTGDILSLQISGASGSVKLEGRARKDADWVTLAGISLADYALVRDGFTKPGIYEIGIIGIRELRARVDSMDGDISVFGQIINSEET